MKQTLKVNEIFTSIQGESTYAGVPCFFIRLAGCNMACSYCDTKYASRLEDGADIEIDELVKKAVLSGVFTVEITGGEPLLQKAALPELCKKLLEKKLTVLVETNGSISVSCLPEGVIRIIDCKTPSSGEKAGMDFTNLDTLKPTDEVKFVISDKTDYDYSVYIIEKYGLADKTDKILFSPAWTQIELSTLAEWILRDKLPVRLQIQMHKIIWGPETKGV